MQPIHLNAFRASRALVVAKIRVSFLQLALFNLENNLAQDPFNSMGSSSERGQASSVMWPRDGLHNSTTLTSYMHGKRAEFSKYNDLGSQQLVILVSRV